MCGTAFYHDVAADDDDDDDEVDDDDSFVGNEKISFAVCCSLCAGHT